MSLHLTRFIHEALKAALTATLESLGESLQASASSTTADLEGAGGGGDGKLSESPQPPSAASR